MCLCLATALKPPHRQTVAVRPRARAVGGIAPIFGMPRGGRSWPESWVHGVAAWTPWEGFSLSKALSQIFKINLGQRLCSLYLIMVLDMVKIRCFKAYILVLSLAMYILSFCKVPYRQLEHDIFEPKSGFLTWSVLAYWAYALKQIYLAGGRAAVLSKEALGPAACAIAGYFLLANLPELLGIALRAGTGG